MTSLLSRVAELQLLSFPASHHHGLQWCLQNTINIVNNHFVAWQCKCTDILLNGRLNGRQRTCKRSSTSYR